MIISGESKQVASAYIAARSEIQTLMPKDGKAHHGRYLTLAAILETVTPILATHDLVILQEPTTNEYGVAVATSILHESGASIDFGPLTMPIADHKPQTVGSAISYCRRYALTAVLGLAGDDDDGQAAQDSFKATADKRSRSELTADCGLNGSSASAVRSPQSAVNDDELWDVPASHAKKPETLSPSQLQRIHILGREVHGNAWKEIGRQMVIDVSKGSLTSSKALSPKEADVLIAQLQAAKAQAQNGKVAV